MQASVSKYCTSSKFWIRHPLKCVYYIQEICIFFYLVHQSEMIHKKIRKMKGKIGITNSNITSKFGKNYIPEAFQYVVMQVDRVKGLTTPAMTINKPGKNIKIKQHWGSYIQHSRSFQNKNDYFFSYSSRKKCLLCNNIPKLYLKLMKNFGAIIWKPNFIIRFLKIFSQL